MLLVFVQTLSTANRLTPKYNIDSWSFDKGYSHKDNKAILTEVVKLIKYL